MAFTYFSDQEYNDAFDVLGGIRTMIAELMSDECNGIASFILDIAAGHGYLSAEVSKLFPESNIVGVGLSSDIKTYLALKASNAYPEPVWSRIQYLGCDCTHLPLNDSSCDLIVNFLGLEDIMMTRGREGVDNTLSEMARVVKDHGLVQIAIVEYGKSPEERIASEIWDTIGLNAVFLPRDEYVDRLEKHGLHVKTETTYEFRKKMNAKQAREELQFACEKAPEIFAPFGVSAISFNRLWDRFGKRIEKYGMAYWSNFRVVVMSK